VSDPRSRIVAGAIWRRKKTGALVRITRAIDTTSVWNASTYYDIGWETVEKPIRRGQSYEEYWLRNCEPVDATARPTPTTDPNGESE
jgi:hypothetical protein